MQHTTLFGDPNGFAYRNTMKTVEDFASIEGAVGEIGDDRTVTMLFADPIVDYFMLILIAYACIVMLRERKSGFWQLVRSTPNGRLRFALNRVGVLFAFSLVSTVYSYSIKGL